MSRLLIFSAILYQNKIPFVREWTAPMDMDMDDFDPMMPIDLPPPLVGVASDRPRKKRKKPRDQDDPEPPKKRPKPIPR